MKDEGHIKQLESERKRLYDALERAVKALERDAWLADRTGGSANLHPAAVNGRKVLESIDVED